MGKKATKKTKKTKEETKKSEKIEEAFIPIYKLAHGSTEEMQRFIKKVDEVKQNIINITK